MKTSFSIIGAWLVLDAVFALGSQGYAQALTTNSMPFGTNGAAPIASVGPSTPFACAIVDHPGVKLPEQGPWTISETDIKQPLGLTVDLVEHRDPMFLFLWNSLSSETRSAMEEERARIVPNTPYDGPGPGIKELVANLNKLIQGKLIYEERAFAPIKPYLSGDTVKLLNQPAGADVSRLNRLLLEDAFLLDIMRRPKILFDPASKNFVFVDFAKKAISLYGQDGKKKWTADLGPSIASWSRIYPYFRVSHIPASQSNVGLWDVSPQTNNFLVKVMGNVYFRINLSTGEVFELPTR